MQNHDQDTATGAPIAIVLIALGLVLFFWATPDHQLLSLASDPSQFESLISNYFTNKTWNGFIGLLIVIAAIWLVKVLFIDSTSFALQMIALIGLYSVAYFFGQA